MLPDNHRQLHHTFFGFISIGSTYYQKRISRNNTFPESYINREQNEIQKRKY